MVGLRIFSDYSPMEREMNRLEKVTLNPKTKAAMDAVLSTGFAWTQGAVHIQTGSLKSSGKMASSMIKDTWRGQISYGGMSLGVNNPVTYAIYEKARDGGHDFMLPLKALDSLFVKAIMEVLKK